MGPRGTGELEREAEEEEEDGDKEDPCEVAFLGASESEVDEELLSDTDDNTHVVNFDWDSGLVDGKETEQRGQDGDAARHHRQGGLYVCQEEGEEWD